MTPPARGPKPKVARLIEVYDLAGIGDELERQWTREEDRKGLRELADEVNRQLLRAVLTNAGVAPIDGEVENLYRLFTDDDVSRGAKTQVRDRLAHHGINVDQLTDDFVTRQAIHTYLTKYRNATPPDRSPSDEEQRGRRLTAIRRLKTRLETVTESVLTDLKDTDRLTLGDFTVIITVRIHCLDCGTHGGVDDLLEAGRCDCGAEEG